MRERLIAWAAINTGTANVRGISDLAEKIEEYAAVLGGVIERCDLPPYTSIDHRGNSVAVPVGPALSIIKRPDALLRVFLCIHTDTVYGRDDPFQTVTSPDGRLRGPGVADAKGGLVVMLTALEALERSPFAPQVGWEVLINPDEEIGSPGSSGLLLAGAKRNHLGLLFEPTLPDGALVDRRRGSQNLSVVIRGKSAHAGRDFASGRSAMVAAARFTLALHALNQTLPGINLNVGAIDGGGPANVVPDLAICRVNIRTTEVADEQKVEQALVNLLTELNAQEGISGRIFPQSGSPPKILSKPERWLLEAAIKCGRDLGLHLISRPSGGACDGNRLSAAGLPNLDTLGVRGGDIHSPSEYMVLDSLVERAQLSALLLMKLANGEEQGIAKQ
ncbi:MAG: hydrolase [Planctomycetota bacterium]|nr:hydrolase [Planctomycetota bacterium]